MSIADELPNPSREQLAQLPRRLDFMPVENPAPETLTRDEIERYNELGYLMPFDGLDPAEVGELRAFFDGVLGAFLELGRDSYSINSAHLRFARIHDLMRHPRLLGPVADLIGPDVVAWGAHFFCKMPHDGRAVPWHQDCAYWPLSPSRTVTLWLAIDDADPGNANMRFVPRSHRHGLIGYEESRDASDVLGLVVAEAEAERSGDAPVDVTLRAGQFSLHSDLLLHGSRANDSDRRRCGLTLRYASAEVRAWYGWERKGFVVRGVDRLGHWADAPRPVTAGTASAGSGEAR
jgi:hypothetical protein